MKTINLETDAVQFHDYFSVLKSEQKSVLIWQLDNITNKRIIFHSFVASVDEDSEYTYTATATDVDVDDYLTFTGTSVPSWLSFNESTGLLFGTPTNDDVGNHDVILTVNDGMVDVTQEFTITVANVNDAPEFLLILNQVVDEGSELSLPVSASDIEGDDITLFISMHDLSSLPSFIDNGNGTGEFIWTPEIVIHGNYSVVF